MASSKDSADKTCASIRRVAKKVLDDFYAENAKVGFYPLPHSALFVIFKAALEVEASRLPQHLRDEREVTDLEAMLGTRLYRQLYHDAVDAYFSHRPELKIKKRTPGPKPKVELAARIQSFVAEGNSSEKIRQILETEGVNLSLSGVQSYRKARYGMTRRKKPQQ